jgi:hypothetical protein
MRSAVVDLVVGDNSFRGTKEDGAKAVADATKKDIAAIENFMLVRSLCELTK